eukprot:TRINITY_DN1659_c0_g1_i1.p2 TRINITY_DN1659_c0_g1~~TRINITY_DN1659_c0_g1_i1.p2  ORF type:complete len:294 (-),score=80.83 TRINITY_DN1659_c0_g1_i1:1169-2050(-)
MASAQNLHTINGETWYCEINEFWPGLSNMIKVEEILHHEQSEYQDVLVVKTSNNGNCLILDGCIQITEKDECSYQEMIAHLPLFSHPNPKKVCIIGGGDGGVLREVCKHSGVEEIHQCEIDQMVIDVSKKYLKGICGAYDDPRFTLQVRDGVQFLKEYKNYFDVIIVDSSDPDGPAEQLFEPPFYRTMYEALTETGVICCQGENYWIHLDFISRLFSSITDIFPSRAYGFCSLPTYPSGGIGFVICGKNVEITKSQAREDKAVTDQCKYYSPEIHQACFVLPKFVADELAGSL